MKRKLFFLTSLLFILALSFMPGKAKADHFAAGDMWIVYVGPGLDGCTGTTTYDYEIYFYMYKPCDQTPIANPATLPKTDIVRYRSQAALDAGHPASLAEGQITIKQEGTNDTMDQLCDVFKANNSCHSAALGAPQGYDRVRLKGTFTLPFAMPDWTFYWASCCTSNGINNVPSFQPFYMEAMLNNVVKYNNSTPQLLVEPLPYICVNQPTSFLNGPFDRNNDSLRTYNTVHYTHANPTAVPTWLVFNADYSVNDPINSASSNPYRMDSATGTATFTPKKWGRYTLDFQSDEYDRKTGVRTGYIRRTCEISVFPCNAPPPNIDSTPYAADLQGGTIMDVITNKKTSKVLVTCPGNKVNFKISGNAKTPGTKIYLEATTDNVPGSTFTVANAGTEQPTGTFEWTPTTADIGEHTMIFTSKDSTCDGTGSLIVLKNYTVILIKVLKGLDAGKDIKSCALNPPTRMLHVGGFGDLPLRVKWSDISGGPAVGIDYDTAYSPLVKAPGGTQYVVYSPDLLDQCKSRDTVELFNDMSNTLDIFPHADRYVLCRPGYLQLDVVANGDGPVDNAKCDTLPDYRTSKVDSIAIYGSPVFGDEMAYDTIGTESPKLESEFLSNKYQFLISQAELREYGLRAGSIKSLSFEIVKNDLPTYEYANFTIYMKCTDKKQLSKADGFETGMVPVYTAPANTTLENGVHTFQFDRPYNWDTTKSIVIGICYSNNPSPAGPCILPGGYPGIFKYMPTTYPSSLDFKDLVTTVDVCGTQKNGFINEKRTRPVFGLAFSDVPGKPFIYNWYPGTLLSDSTIKAPLTYSSKTTTYMVSSLGKNGCKIADTMEVYIPVHDFRVFPDDTSICYGQTTPLEIKKGTYYQWFEYEEGKYLSANNSLSCEYCANPTAKPQKSTRYKIMVGDDVFCYDTIDAYVEVRPLPLVNILTKDTIIKFGQSVQLLVNGGKLYNWSPVSSLNNPNISYPIATPTEPTMYVVSGINSTGCYSYDTVRVGISYRDNLQIPTAFTPNGDGKNDQFRVNNMTFQRFVEFRVFNRWGQEVYQGGDPKSGWDGNWKGVPQEMGNYQYIIRVGSPDGLVETYKGDVTLIR